MNAKLKRYQSWEVVPIDEFVDNISDIYKMQEEKIFGAMTGQGPWKFAAFVAKKYKLTPEAFSQLSKEQQDNLLLQFCQGKPKKPETLVSADGLYETPYHGRSSGMPGGSRRTRGQRTVSKVARARATQEEKMRKRRTAAKMLAPSDEDSDGEPGNITFIC